MSVRKIARETGLSVATVSRALCGGTKVGSVSRSRVRSAALSLGYSPNSYVSQMMSSLRRRKAACFRGCIALITNQQNETQAADDVASIHEGAAARAEELGFHIEKFDGTACAPESMKRILSSRGIRGALISMKAQRKDIPSWPAVLEGMCCVALGRAAKAHPVDAVLADDFRMMELAVQHAAVQFGSAFAALWNGNADPAFTAPSRAAFLQSHPAGPAEAARLFWTAAPVRRNAHGMRKVRALLIGPDSTPPPSMAARIPPENWIWFRNPAPAARLGHLDPQHSLIGRWGMDLIAARIQRGEFAAPHHAQTILVPPLWRTG